ncbi:hypothetical protein JIM95_000635 [Corynebacterium sp. CCM 8835]|uniref:Uncharacterized protein n=1 Tax=Corynebacterium antarcticum TaxID=2800405 RepID=A0A9Q4CAT9_9CORY|nr:hypothetical protein [Corynebacterium antarcticum]MCK7641431.1 hypothetical protein [Corynebacterium antarcticum]MCK7660467.1 hypothetical protein [Corynebacterium antarcticum]MCL0244662.1 hypothetical protein [Corynebacterium antarcticum]MCX7491032.1 hypothetical protein [Corynebacterium antarcticum]MCX7537058.1 hypothetical protein [Corynebacterium antarcticum]
MDFRPLVYSPLQNAAVWLAGWLYGRVSYDNLLDAFGDYGARHTLVVRGPDGAGSAVGDGLIGLLRHFRETAAPVLPLLDPGEPVLRLVFGGPGQVPGLIAGSPAAEAARDLNFSALVIRDPDPEINHVLLPGPGLGDPGGVIQWRWYTEPGRVPEPDHLGPGDADRMLAEATSRAADLIEARGFRRSPLPDPRLTVGRLDDFYSGPGLPDSAAPRAVRVFARADRVAAIIESVVTEAGDHSHDAELTQLLTHLRTARMAGVAYAVGEYGRGS